MQQFNHTIIGLQRIHASLHRHAAEAREAGDLRMARLAQEMSADTHRRIWVFREKRLRKEA